MNTLPTAALTPRPTLRPFIAGSMAIGFAVWGQLRLQVGASGEALFLFGLALLLFVHAFHRLERWSPQPLPERKGEGSGYLGLLRARRSLLFWLGVGFGLGAVALAGLALHQFHGSETPPLSAWMRHLVSVVALLLALYLLDNRVLPAMQITHDEDDLGVFGRSRLRVLLLLILVGALFLRLHRLSELPFGTWYDEAENGLQALRVLENPNFRPIYVQSTHAPAHYVYLIAAAFRVFDVSTQSIRLVSVAMGMGTVLAGYLLGREFFGRIGGLLLATLFAVSRWDINLSRIGMYNISTPLFALLTIGFLLRGIRRRRLSDFGLAGLSLGLGLCFYAAFQLFVIVVAVFLLALLVMRRGFFRQYWPGLVAMALMALLVFAPVLLFAYDNPDDYFGRTRDTSLFADKSPEQRMPALIDNTVKHLSMFNIEGDPNGRHNLPGEPMLDPISAALMVLGLGLAFWHVREPLWLLLPIWLGVMILGGILSLDFEAPQSLRAVGTLPVAYLLAAVPLYLLWRAWMSSDGHHFPSFYAWVALAFLLPITFLNYRMYFSTWATDFASWNAFSTPETITANLLNQRDESVNAHVISFYDGHPTVNFLAGFDQDYERVETTDQLPFPVSADRDLLLILDGERQSLFEEARRLYPAAQFVEHKPPFGGPTVVYSALVAADDLASIQGLEGRYFANADWTGAPILTQRDRVLNLDWTTVAPLAPPFSVEWAGVLRVDEYGLHQFSFIGSDIAELRIDNDLLIDGDPALEPAGIAAGRSGGMDVAVVLAKGNHTIGVRTAVPDDEAMDRFQLVWRPPDRGAEVVPAQALYTSPVRANGLLGRYFANDSWSDPEAFAQIDPQLNLYFHIIPLPRPYTVEWTGLIAIPEDGRYQFGLESIDESWLSIDGEEVVASLAPNEYAVGSIDLAAGFHDIRIRFADRTDHTHINLTWNPPWRQGSQPEPIPSAVLYPPQSSYDQLAAPTLEALGLVSEEPGRARQQRSVAFSVVEILVENLFLPKGVAVGSGADSAGPTYVAEPETGRVVVIDAGGEQIDAIGGYGAGERNAFVAPFDVAVDEEDRVYVLDADAAQIGIFDTDGSFLRNVPSDLALLDRARGIDVDEKGTIWAAHTPGGRIVGLSQDGELLREFPVWPGKDAQPVDVLAASGGDLFVSDAGLHKLIRYDAAGRRLLAWDIPVANSVDGSHLAEGDDGRVYVTIPERAQVWIVDPDASWIEERSIFTQDNQPVKPVGIDIDGDGRILVADTNIGRVLRLSD
jgi:4-amino-4-deoxy-L-arabinose transferase-like glycosyltransferase/sugar lactone lactonase YvrE